MARDWLKAFRPASFRGVPFKVNEDLPAVGRRVAVHDISGGEAPVTEDMGRLATSVHVIAYLAGETADIEAQALELACAAPGPSILVLPMDAPRTMHCVGCERNRAKDRAGYVAYRLQFVEAGSGLAASSSPIGAMRAVMGSAAPALSAALAKLF